MGIIKKQKVLYTLYLILMFIGLYPLKWNKLSLLLKLSQYHTTLLDLFFYYISILGHFTMYILLLTILMISKSKINNIITTIVTFLGISFVVQLIKIITYSPRPITQLGDSSKFNFFIDKINYASNYTSLPSGHASVIFSITTLIAIYYNIKWYYSILLLIISLTIAYSRIYLMHHFYLDVYIGAIIGIAIATIANYIILKFSRIIN